MSSKPNVNVNTDVVVNGVAYANPLNDDRYLVKIFPLPEAGDLEGCIRLMKSFERRFLLTADGGRKTLNHEGNLDAYVDKKRVAYEDTTGGAKELAGASLCMALLERGIRQAKDHIEERMRVGGGDKVALDALKIRVQDDLMEAVRLFKNVRRRKGHMDVDGVLDEMKGEPYNIFVGTFPEAKGKLEHFRANRLHKAAMAMQCIDGVVESVSGLAESHASLRDGGMLAMIKELGEAAKCRLQLQREDDDFKDSDIRLTIARNAIHAFKPSVNTQLVPSHLPSDHAGKVPVSPTSMELLRNAADLIADIALVRVPRKVSAAELKARVEEHRAAVSMTPRRPTS